MPRTFRVSVIGVALLALVALGFFTHIAMEGDSLQGDAFAGAPVASKAVELGGQKFERWGAPRPLPDLKFSDPAGRPASLADFRGRLVLLNLWATWCPPCREEMPALDRLNARLGGDKFVVIALALDSPGKAEAFLRQIKAGTLGAYTDSQGLALSTLRVTTVPTTLLIDARGRELGRLSGAAPWDEKPALELIQSYLKEPT
ncbi:MAG: redoxin domain-containing protein [Hydrogenophaga sp.]|uniref:TlpA family protein disulfide reductase n=1 Tax=Hydrogenophaga sp. TaxID=1904254 RepID=UPI0016B8B481|nr:TlpA disulfide reductase family protein [Hydrogenophaga sp.]NIM42841.1 redoxin domain-containing protein [Hydrogenophaga sp.]NIN27774.1 redoxin domain-containing protein [Hydrogenophaga sp.]NIN32593.1 redoxin domain-containing protein [Hydrogenophaga sp.]NIN57047.1 redoxin domain-containing protein [Hydrogenophaga sp.]NIO53458.1 redoxin domain-containing protein [Hydrogenophaga sp.]